MKITVTFENCKNNKKFDIQVDNKQKIATTIRVLRDNLPDAVEELEEELIVKSKRSKKRVDLKETYEHEMIFSGDILSMNHEYGPVSRFSTK